MLRLKPFNNGGHSIARLLRQHAVRLGALLVIPLLLTLFGIFLTLRRYDDVIDNVEQARQLKNGQVEQLEAEIWLIVSGRKPVADGRQHQLIAAIRSKLDDLLEHASAETRQHLTAAERAIASAERHVFELETQLAEGRSARSNIKQYEEIRAVSQLTGAVLNDYIEQGNQQIAALNSRIQKAFIYLFVLMILLLVSIALLTANMARRVTRNLRQPILELEHFTGRIAGGALESRIAEPDLTELKTLAADLNKMAAKLDDYFADKLEAESNLRKAELRALQAQIKPHFIYNTLGTIVWLAEQERSDDVVKMSMALTTFLRLSLSGGAEIISVEKEVEHVESYLDIQRFRYGNRISYDVDIDPAILSLPMLKFTLQPLVENAIYHGIKGKRFSRGNITVTGRLEEDTVVFTVRDTGQGITPERLAELKTRLAEVTADEASPVAATDEGGYGLINVASRLWLYHGATLDIDGKPGEGAVVAFSFPRRTS